MATASCDPTPTILWALLTSGRNQTPIAIFGEPGQDAEEYTVYIGMGNMSKRALNSKEVLWMYTAGACFCCGCRHRELLCPRENPEEGLKHYEKTHGKLLKFFEVGQDVRNMCRIELMYHDGDMLSLGWRCESEDDTRFFRTFCNVFQGQLGLMSCKATSCRAQRRLMPSAAVYEQDDAAEAEADRHMAELLAEEVAKDARAELRKKKARAKTGHKQPRSSPETPAATSSLDARGVVATVGEIIVADRKDPEKIEVEAVAQQEQDVQGMHIAKQTQSIGVQTQGDAVKGEVILRRSAVAIMAALRQDLEEAKARLNASLRKVHEQDQMICCLVDQLRLQSGSGSLKQEPRLSSTEGDHRASASNQTCGSVLDSAVNVIVRNTFIEICEDEISPSGIKRSASSTF
eukprot:TRINITY_DN23248_c0_g1_i1.p1 TRINITY_DN23248_c0_g1~~TRINITY_DN23248_c0_g1_i1.p1  ORF type:complete len:419 (-),score=92.60 TRINITY_DN23248_c0_g1_i1:424-1635(-)